MSAREALELATVGGARVLGRDDIGRIAPGYRADIAIWDVSGIESGGSWDASAIVLAGPRRVRDLIVDGHHIVKESRMSLIDERRLVDDAQRCVERLGG